MLKLFETFVTPVTDCARWLAISISPSSGTVPTSLTLPDRAITPSLDMSTPPPLPIAPRTSRESLLSATRITFRVEEWLDGCAGCSSLLCGYLMSPSAYAVDAATTNVIAAISDPICVFMFNSLKMRCRATYMYSISLRQLRLWMKRQRSMYLQYGSAYSALSD